MYADLEEQNKSHTHSHIHVRSRPTDVDINFNYGCNIVNIFKSENEKKNYNSFRKNEKIRKIICHASRIFPLGVDVMML